MLDGVVEAVNRSTIAAQTGGQITEIHFDVDDFVEKGQVIVRLRDSQQKAALTAAEAQLKQAETALQDAQDTYDRAVKVFDKGAISEADMDKITAALESARAAGEAAAAGVDQEPWKRLGEAIGAAYQVADDIQDATSTAAELGKPCGVDRALDRLHALRQADAPGTVVVQVDALAVLRGLDHRRADRARPGRRM